MISKAASGGLYLIWYYEVIKDDVRKKLIEDGYKVGETISERNESLTDIRW